MPRHSKILVVALTAAAVVALVSAAAMIHPALGLATFGLIAAFTAYAVAYVETINIRRRAGMED